MSLAKKASAPFSPPAQTSMTPSPRSANFRLDTTVRITTSVSSARELRSKSGPDRTIVSFVFDPDDDDDDGGSRRAKSRHRAQISVTAGARSNSSRSESFRSASARNWWFTSRRKRSSQNRGSARRGAGDPSVSVPRRRYSYVATNFGRNDAFFPLKLAPPPAAAALGVAPAGPSADDRHGEHEAGRHGWRSSPSRAPRTEEDLARVLRSSPVVTLKLALAPCRLVIARAPLARAPAAPRCVSRARP